MKKRFVLILISALALTSSIISKIQEMSNVWSSNELLMANVEALSDGDMPHVKDCVYDKNTNCEALHPTDPSKDEFRKHAKWPSK